MEGRVVMGLVGVDGGGVFAEWGRIWVLVNVPDPVCAWILNQGLARFFTKIPDLNSAVSSLSW